MEQLAAKLTFKTQENATDAHLINPPEIRLIQSSNQCHYVYYRNQLLAQYQKNDNYTRNMVVVQLFLCHKVPQKSLSHVFQLTVPHISSLVSKYRKTGSEGIQDNTVVRIGNNQKIKGKVADEIVKQLKNLPSYEDVGKIIKQKYGVQISTHRLGCWWRAYEKENNQQQSMHAREQRVLPIEARATVNDIEQNLTDTAEPGQNTEAINDEANGCDNTETPAAETPSTCTTSSHLNRRPTPPPQC